MDRRGGTAEPELLVALQGALKLPEVIVVVGAQVGVGRHIEHRLRQAARRARVGIGVESLEPDPGGGAELAQIDEPVVLLGAGHLAPAILAVVAAAHVPVHSAPREPGDVPLASGGTAAAARELERAARRAVPAGGDEVDRAAERVPAQQRAVAREDLDPVDVVHRQQVEIHLRGLRLVHAHAVEKDRDALRQAHHRGRVESPGRDVELVGAADVVVGREAGHLVDRIRENARLVCVHLARTERGHPRRHPRADRGPGRGTDTGDDLDGRELQHLRGVPRGRIGHLRREHARQQHQQSGRQLQTDHRMFVLDEEGRVAHVSAVASRRRGRPRRSRGAARKSPPSPRDWGERRSPAIHRPRSRRRRSRGSNGR